MRPRVGTALRLESPVSLLTPPRFLHGWMPPSSLPTERAPSEPAFLESSMGPKSPFLLSLEPLGPAFLI